MNHNWYYQSMLMFLLILTGCRSTAASPAALPSATPTPYQAPVFVPSATFAPSATLLATATSPVIATAPAAETLDALIHPLINVQPGEPHAQIFTIPVGGDSPIQYFRGAGSMVEAPNALAVLQDGRFLIADPIGNQLLYFNAAGELLNTVQLDKLGIQNVLDMSVRDGDVYLLATSYQNYQVHYLTQDGTLLSSEKFSSLFPVDDRGYTLENVLMGIAVDCDGNVLLNLKSGREFYPLAWVQNHSDLAGAPEGFSCSNQTYRVSQLIPPRISSAYQTYETSLTTQLGSLRVLDIFQDGSIYLIRSDLMSEQPGSARDLTVHYIDGSGTVQGAARMPVSDEFFQPARSLAVGPDGEVYMLLPRLNGMEVLRLNFYTSLEPLQPGAALPQVTVVPVP